MTHPSMQCNPKCALQVTNGPETTVPVYNEKSTESESKQLEMFIMILQSNSIPVTYNNKNLYFALIF